MRSLALLKRQLVLLKIGVINEQAHELTQRHGHCLHVGMVKPALMSALIDHLTSHQFVG